VRNFLEKTFAFLRSKEFLAVSLTLGVPLLFVLSLLHSIENVKFQQALACFAVLFLVLAGFSFFLSALRLWVSDLFHVVVLIPLSLLIVAGFSLVHTYGRINSEVLSSFVYILMNSNLAESLDYISVHGNTFDFLLLLVLLAFPFVFGTLRRKYTVLSPKEIRVGAGGFLVVLGAATFLSVPKAMARIVRPFEDGERQYSTEKKELASLSASSRWDDLKVTRSIPADKSEETYVVVVGESTGRHNMSLYGYERDTTPRLNQERNGLWVFSDVISAHAHTIPVLQTVFTFANHERPNAWEDTPDLITLAKKAGFKTWWLSNQNVLGASGIWMTGVASKADVVFYASGPELYGPTKAYDENLMEAYKKALDDPFSKKIIFLHLIGTHQPAANRFPEKFRVFGPASPRPASYARVFSKAGWRIIDAYDNAVLYQDWIITQFLQLLKAHPEQEHGAAKRAFLYFSDHGDEVLNIDGYYGHNEARCSRFMLEIPMIFWANDEIAKSFRVPKKEMEARPYQTDSLIHSLLDLFRIRFERFDERRSIFSPAFKPAKRWISGIDYDVWRQSPASDLGRITYPPVGERHFLADIWLHRTDSLPKFLALADKFGGFELDLVIQPDKGVFDVTHPPVPSIGLSFEEILRQPAAKGKYFWMDVKNLNPGNLAFFQKHLGYLDQHYAIKDRVIIESDQPALLTPLTHDGYYTSYYLPDPPEGRGVPSGWIEAISKTLSANDVRAFSCPDSSYEKLKDRFPEHDALVWYCKDPDERLRDKRVQVVLVPVKTADDR